MEKITTKYKDSNVYFTTHNGRWSMNPHRCFCCNNFIQDGKAILVVNNHQYIPNVLIHEECFDGWKNKTDELVSDIESAYVDYKNLQEVFG